uniref:Uncharacterized protein n=1 Tax=Hucho hucho TaxID=62062 RepID=A0A4W5JWW0_9TELE
MHQLFGLVLGKRDLSRAGDLFSLEDSDIEDCLSQALEEIKAISCSPVSTQARAYAHTHNHTHSHTPMHPYTRIHAHTNR